MLTLHLSIVLLLIVVNGFSRWPRFRSWPREMPRLRPLAEAGNLGALAALELKANPSRLLATVQIGITVIAILSGTFGEATLGDQLQRQLEDQGGWLARYAYAISMAIVVIGIAYFSLILGELVPKRIALVASRAHRGRDRPNHADVRPRWGADRMVPERLDKSCAAPPAVAQRRGGAGDRRRDHLYAA